jgi:predicted RNase H-like HicB family nuclease
MLKQLTAIIEREGDGYVSLCPELDIASQGDSALDARNNLREAIELFFETASQLEIQVRSGQKTCDKSGGCNWVTSVFSPERCSFNTLCNPGRQTSSQPYP